MAISSKLFAVVNTSDASGANNATSAGVTALVKNRSDYDVTTKTTFGDWVAKYPGAVGNALRVSVCDSVPGQFSNTSLGFSANVVSGSNIVRFEGNQVRNLEFVKGDVITFSSTANAPESDFGRDSRTPPGPFILLRTSHPGHMLLLKITRLA